MKLTTVWLLNYLEPRVSHDALMDAFPKFGLEIESSEPLATGEGFLVDLNVLANRPDCLGILGVAREVAAHLDLKLVYPTFAETIVIENGPSPASVEILDPDFCARYMGRVMTGVKVGPSPKWLSDAITSIGHRSINNIVDITNFVMFEWGQPLHAFDFSSVRGGKIVVRRMRAGEKLELLGGKTIDAGSDPQNAPTLAICDSEHPMALAGIMGGKQSETRDATTQVLVESAHFDPPTIRRSRKRVDLSTDASFRFERGVDPNRMLEGALHRACSLIAELAGGRPAGATVDAYPKRREPVTYSLTAARVSAYLGAEISNDTIKASLEKLEMRVEPQADALRITVPTWRIDATDPVVLIEDVARLVGYDALPMRPTLQRPTAGARSAMDELRQTLAGYLSSAGFLECRNPSLESPEQVASANDDAASVVRLKNPMSREYAELRTSLLPSLVRVIERNARRGATGARVYESDNVFRMPGESEKRRDLGAAESLMLACVAGGTRAEADWSDGGKPVTFFDLKGVVEDLLDLAHATNVSFVPVERPGFARDACAAIRIGARAADPQTVGHVGQIDVKRIDAGKTSFKLFAFELALAPLLAFFESTPAYAQLARTPAVVRDLAFVMKMSVPFADVDRAMRAAVERVTLESMRLVDVYQGKPIEPGHHSLALRLTFRAADRTLTSEEVQAEVDRVVAAMKQQFDATLRA